MLDTCLEVLLSSADAPSLRERPNLCPPTRLSIPLNLLPIVFLGGLIPIPSDTVTGILGEGSAVDSVGGWTDGAGGGGGAVAMFLGGTGETCMTGVLACGLTDSLDTGGGGGGGI